MSSISVLRTLPACAVWPASRLCMDACFALADEKTKTGDEVVFLGRQGDDEIDAEEIARKVGTIPYEILVGFKRMPRFYV